MLSIFVGCLVFGGILLGASTLGGDGDHDTDHDAGAHAPAGVLPFLSLRFWSFAIGFFGLTGTALTLLEAASAAITLALSGGVGVGAGYGAARVLQALAHRPVGLLTASPVGREGTLLLPVAPGQRGKVRLSIGGVSTDLVATTDNGRVLPTGATVLVVGMRGTVALVEPTPVAALPSPEKETS